MRLSGDADPLKVIKVAAKDGRSGEDIQLHYSNYKVAGNGSFGVVYQAKLLRTGDDVAIKKVLQDKRFKVISFFSILFFVMASISLKGLPFFIS